MIIFLLFLLSLCILQIIHYKSYNEEFFWAIIITTIIIYIPGTIYYYATTGDSDNLIIFYSMFFLSVFSFSLGFFCLKRNQDKKITPRTEGNITKFIFIGILFEAFNNLIIKNFINDSQIFTGLFFIIDDLSVIFFWGGASLLFFYRNNDLKRGYIGKNFLLLIFCILLHVIPQFYYYYQGIEVSRFSIVFPVFFILYLYFYFIRKKVLMMTGVLLSIFFIFLFFNFFYGGDLLVLNNGIDVITALNNNQTTYKYFMIPYNIGLYMFPDFFNLKPVLYNPNAQYMLDIMEWGLFDIRSHPWGYGITGVVDAYWNLGYAGIILYFFLAGLYLSFLKRISLKYSSPFFYGIYIFQVVTIILLYRMDFSFYFRRLIIILPLLYFLYKSYGIAFKDKILIKFNIVEHSRKE